MRCKILFDASCVLAALGSSRGGSFRLLNLIKKSKHTLFLSEISVEEVKRHLGIINSTKRELLELIDKYIDEVVEAPTLKEIKSCRGQFADEDDLYLLATAQKIDAHFLVSLDKKHVLSQSKKIKRPKITSPGETLKTLFR